MELRKLGCEDVDWMKVAEDHFQMCGAVIVLPRSESLPLLRRICDLKSGILVHF